MIDHIGRKKSSIYNHAYAKDSYESKRNSISLRFYDHPSIFAKSQNKRWEKSSIYDLSSIFAEFRENQGDIFFLGDFAIIIRYSQILKIDEYIEYL